VLLPVLAVALSLPIAQPVRLTLDPVTVGSGDRVRVFVDVASGGHLLVLRVGVDGRVAIVFPFDPAEGTFVDAGSYEVRPPGDPTAFAALEPPGSGVVVAALAQVPYEFDEFVRAGRWNPAAFAAAGLHSDATGKLLDIVQRMLGPAYFNYDVAAYTVVPAATGAPVTTASYGSTWCWTYGCAFGGWYGPWAPRPCLYSAWGCGFVPPACRDVTIDRWCDRRPCWGGVDCRSRPSRDKAIATHRRGVPIHLSGPPRGPGIPPGEPTPYRPRERSSDGHPAAFAGASRALPLSSGKKVATPTTRSRLPTTAWRPAPDASQGAARKSAPVPERVPWPTSVIASGEKTPAPAVRPREARLKQSASRPPLPERVPWPTTATRAPGKAKPASVLTPAATSAPARTLPASIGPRLPRGFPSSIDRTKAPTSSRAMFPTAARGGSTGTVGTARAATGGGRALAPASSGRSGPTLKAPARSK